MDEGWGTSNEPWYKKMLNALEEAWPTIYRWINDLFFGAIHLIKFILGGLWPGR